MTVREANILLSDAAALSNGIDFGNVHIWYGGPFSVVSEGNFAGATKVDLVFCTKLPSTGLSQDYIDNPGNYNWISLHQFTGNGFFNLDNLNPCAIAAQVSSINAASRIIVRFN